jgi:hypothetical protein
VTTEAAGAKELVEKALIYSAGETEELEQLLVKEKYSQIEVSTDAALGISGIEAALEKHFS